MLHTSLSAEYCAGDLSANSSRKMFNFGNLVNAFEVQSGATLGFEGVEITGMPWNARGTPLTADLPFANESFLFPSVVQTPNSLVMPCLNVQLCVHFDWQRQTCGQYAFPLPDNLCQHCSCPLTLACKGRLVAMSSSHG